jgi:hypothetical protein
MNHEVPQCIIQEPSYFIPLKHNRSCRSQYIHTCMHTLNNLVDWLHSGAAMYCSRYVEPQDGAMSILLLSQQEVVACVQCIQKESHCCER